VAPYGVYVLNNNAAFVNLGTSADTGLFSVESIRRWWHTVGKENFCFDAIDIDYIGPHHIDGHIA